MEEMRTEYSITPADSATNPLLAAKNSGMVDWIQDKGGYNVPVLAKMNVGEEKVYPDIEDFVGATLRMDLEKMPTLFMDLMNHGMTTPVSLTTKFVKRKQYMSNFPTSTNMEGDNTRYGRGSRVIQTIPVLITTTGTTRNYRDSGMDGMEDEQEAREDLVRERDRIILRGAGKTYDDGLGNSVASNGVINSSHVNAVTWDHQGSNIYTEIQKLIKPLRDKEIDAPLCIYFSHNFGETLDADYKVYGSDSLKSRTMKNGGIAAIKTLTGLADNEALVIPLSKRYVEVLVAVNMAMIPVPAQNDGTSMAFKHLTAFGLRVNVHTFKNNQNATGIVYGT